MSHAVRPSRRIVPAAVGPVVTEMLEPRRLLAAIFVDSERSLHVEGSPGNDTLSLERVGIDDVFVRVVQPGGPTLSGTFDLDDLRNVQFRGFAGDDTITDIDAVPMAVFVSGEAGNDTIALPDLVTDVEIVERRDANGGEGDDVIRGGNGGDFIDGQGGKDSVFGGDGADWIEGGSGSDVLRGEGDGDRMYDASRVDSDPDAMFGGGGNDTMEASGGNDYLEGNDGHDWLIGGDQHDTLLGNNGDDVLDGDDGTDSLVGGAGKTAFLRGETGFTDPTSPALFVSASGLVVAGTGGNDTITLARTGVDDVRVTVNNSTFVFDLDDTLPLMIVGHRGNDRVTVGLDVPIGGITLEGGNGNDTLIGNNGEDSLVGGSGRDHLSGRGGDDRFRTFDSEIDTLLGGDGEDTAFADPMDVLDSIEET